MNSCYNSLCHSSDFIDLINMDMKLGKVKKGRDESKFH